MFTTHRLPEYSDRRRTNTTSSTGNAISTCQTTRMHQGKIGGNNEYRYFLNDICKGRKKYVTNDKVKKAFCPQIEGLYMKDLLEFIVEREHLLEYFPDVDEIPKQGKAWIKNMLRILCENDFRSWVNDKCRLHREKND